MAPLPHTGMRLMYNPQANALYADVTMLERVLTFARTIHAKGVAARPKMVKTAKIVIAVRHQI